MSDTLPIKYTQIMDLTGHQYGRVTVVKLAPYTKAVTWECLCSCGKTAYIQANNLRSGHTRSCGCYQEETKGQHSKTHGATYTPAYYVHSTMMARCYRGTHDKYAYYGGRGITVCERWHSFQNFLADMGQPEGRQIDRIDNNKGYSPENCRWVSRKENMRNKRNNNKVFYDGREIVIPELAEITGLPAQALYRRIRRWGMTVDEAILNAKHMRRRFGKKTDS